MIFYALHLPGYQPRRLEYIKAACQKLKIHCVPLDPETFDFSKPSPVKKGDLVYRLSRGKLLRFFEDYIVRPGCVTFYQNPVFHKPDPFLLQKNGISIPKTIFCVSKSRMLMMEYVRQLGGFPVVVKALGGTKGMGVMKIDTITSLLGVADFLLHQKKFFVLKQYLPVRTSARLIVLGNQIVASMEYKAKDLDFRTNSGKKLDVRSKKYPKSFEDLAVRATQAMGWEFGGVDILVHKGKPYVSEVNFPCNFVRAYNVLNLDIASMIVKYLQQKAKKLQ